MKFSLAFLCALVVISHQQLQKPRGMVWFSPYYSLTNPSPVINNYPSQYYGSHPDDESLFFRNLRIAYPQKEELIDDQMNKHNIDEYPRSRFTGFYQPSFSQQQQNARLFFGGAIANSFMRTATFTVTSTLSVTSVQPCIPAGQFTDVPAGNTLTAACRRRKRQILEAFDPSEDTQFLIHPSKTNQVIPTALVPLIKDQQLSARDDQAESKDNAGIISSKDEISQQHDQLSTHSNLQDKNTREKRFFFMNGIISTTVTQYSIISTITTKTLGTGLAAVKVLSCLPPGIIVCPAAAG